MAVADWLEWTGSVSGLLGAFLNEINTRHDELSGRVQQMEADAGRLSAGLAAERQAIEVARVALTKAELRLEALPRFEAEIENLRTERDEAHKQAAVMHEAAAVAAARLEMIQGNGGVSVSGSRLAKPSRKRPGLDVQ